MYCAKIMESNDEIKNILFSKSNLIENKIEEIKFFYQFKIF